MNILDVQRNLIKCGKEDYPITIEEILKEWWYNHHFIFINITGVNEMKIKLKCIICNKVLHIREKSIPMDIMINHFKRYHRNNKILDEIALCFIDIE